MSSGYTWLLSWCEMRVVSVTRSRIEDALVGISDGEMSRCLCVLMRLHVSKALERRSLSATRTKRSEFLKPSILPLVLAYSYAVERNRMPKPSSLMDRLTKARAMLLSFRY